MRDPPALVIVGESRVWFWRRFQVFPNEPHVFRRAHVPVLIFARHSAFTEKKKIVALHYILWRQFDLLLPRLLTGTLVPLLLLNILILTFKLIKLRGAHTSKIFTMALRLFCIPRFFSTIDFICRTSYGVLHTFGQYFFGRLGAFFCRINFRKFCFSAIANRTSILVCIPPRSKTSLLNRRVYFVK